MTGHVDFSAYGPGGAFLCSLDHDVPNDDTHRRAALDLLRRRILAGDWPEGSVVVSKPTGAGSVHALPEAKASAKPDLAKASATLFGAKAVTAPVVPPEPMKVRQLFVELARIMEMGGGDDLIFVESHGIGSPLLYTEPGDGLENLTLVGTELETPATPRTSRRRARARHLLYNEPKRPDPRR